MKENNWVSMVKSSQWLRTTTFIHKKHSQLAHSLSCIVLVLIDESNKMGKYSCNSPRGSAWPHHHWSNTYLLSIHCHAEYSHSEMKENNWVSMVIIITMVQINHIHSKPALTIYPFIVMHCVGVNR